MLRAARSNSRTAVEAPAVWISERNQSTYKAIQYWLYASEHKGRYCANSCGRKYGINNSGERVDRDCIKPRWSVAAMGDGTISRRPLYIPSSIVALEI